MFEVLEAVPSSPLADGKPGPTRGGHKTRWAFSTEDDAHIQLFKIRSTQARSRMISRA
jgi:hypothetical protein